MGSYNWGYKFPNMGYNYSSLLITPLITTHEPPSIFYHNYLGATSDTISNCSEGALNNYTVFVALAVTSHDPFRTLGSVFFYYQTLFGGPP